MSACTLPSLTVPTPKDVLAALVALLAALGISIPPLPSIPFPLIPCPLDA